MSPKSVTSTEGRWLLYRLLAEPTRVRLLALTAEAELSIGELAELLDELQPNVSRHVAALCQGSVLLERRQGTRNFIRLSPAVRQDVVVEDALNEGKRLCLVEGRLERIARILRAREVAVKGSLNAGEQDGVAVSLARELPAYVLGLSKAFSGRKLAVDVATGDGARLDVLAPFFRRVVAIECHRPQLEQVERRIVQRGYRNVEVLHGNPEDREVLLAVGDGACAVFANHVLSPNVAPKVALTSLVALLREGGTVVVFEPAAEENAPEELRQLAHSCGLTSIEVSPIPAGFVHGVGEEPRPWQLLTARRTGPPHGESSESGNSSLLPLAR